MQWYNTAAWSGGNTNGIDNSGTEKIRSPPRWEFLGGLGTSSAGTGSAGVVQTALVPIDRVQCRTASCSTRLISRATQGHIHAYIIPIQNEIIRRQQLREREKWSNGIVVETALWHRQRDTVP